MTMIPALHGVLPVAPTVFNDDESLDLPGQRRVTEFLIEAGSAAICVLANYSEQFSLTDDERVQVLQATLDQADGRVPVIATTSAYSARIARDRSLDAQRRGAAMVMLMPPFFGTTITVADAAVRNYFHTVADGLDIDIMLQDAPMSPTRLSVELLSSLASEISNVRHVKIEMPRTAAKVRALIAAAGDTLPGVYDGEEAITLIPDLDAGVRATMSSAVIPEVLAHIVADFHAGRRDKAVEEWERILPLIHYENRQCGLAAAKLLLHRGAVIGSARCRAPFPELAPLVAAELEQLAIRKDALVLRWAE
jgi:4-hydroxy-tetrahydrodipicolinate synthase